MSLVGNLTFSIAQVTTMHLTTGIDINLTQEALSQDKNRILTKLN